MSADLPVELETRCAQILDPEAQGEPLSAIDYVLFAIVTVLVPAVLIVIGAAL